MIAGIGIPIELRDQSITIGTVVKAFYLLPTNSTDYTQPSIDYVRKKRSSTRWVTYKLIENFLQRSGYGDGKACLLRSICEVAAQPFERKTGILAEIIHAVLTWAIRILWKIPLQCNFQTVVDSWTSRQSFELRVSRSWKIWKRSRQLRRFVSGMSSQFFPAVYENVRVKHT